MKNFTFLQLKKIATVALATFLFSFITIFAKAQAVYTTAFGDWSQSWNFSSGFYQASGGPGLFSSGSGNTSNGQVNARLLTSDGTTSGTQQALNVGQKLIIRLTAPDGGGRSGIETGGRIGFSLRNTTNLFDDGGSGSGFNRYATNAMLRVEFQGGQAAAQLVDGNGTTQSGMPGFGSFVAGITYEVEMVSDKEFNLQVVGGTRYNIHAMSATGTIKQISIANLGSNKDAVYTLVEVANTPTVSVVANTSETFTVAGVVSNNGATANSLTKTGVGTVILTGQNTYTGSTIVSNGTLRLNAASANTINAGNNVSIASGATLQVSQDQALGNLDVPSGATLIVDAGKTLTITGAFTGGGTITNNGTIVMAGTSAQSFPGSGTVSAMNNLTINNNSATGVTLNAGSLTVTGTLSFLANGGTKALLTTGANVITASTVSGASAANGWVNGNLQKNITASGVKVFEVGDAAFYTPASLNFSGSGFTAGNIRVSTRNGISTATGFASLSLLSSTGINRVWSVTKPGGSSFTGSFTGTFTYVAGDLIGSPSVSALRSGAYNGSMWYYHGPVTAGASQVTAAGGMIPLATYDIVFATPRPVTITGVTITPKVYDAGVSASVNFGSAVLNGIVNGNFVNIDAGVASGVFADKHVGNGKPVTISGVALSSPGLDAGAYILSAQPSASGDITQRPITITAATNTKTYDGSTSASATPVITPAGPTGLQGLDVANFTETYDTKNAGTGKTLTATGSVSDGNNGNNYAYSFVTNNTGVINNIAITGLSATPGSITCNGGTTTLLVSASGGDGQLQYSLSGTASFPYQSSTTFTGVGAGSYTLTVKDEDNFTAQLTDIIVGQPGILTANVVKTNLSKCNVAPDGTITVTPSGGTGPYTYSWTGETGSNHTPFSAGNVSSLSGLNYGYYNVTITDAGGCGIVTINNIHIEIGYQVFITNSGSVSSVCGNTGSLIFYGNSGLAPYQWSLTSASGPWQGNTFTGLAAGTYTVWVKDNGGCINSKTVTVGSAPAIVVSPNVVGSSSCNNDGSIQIFRTGGTPGYTYSITSATGPWQTSNFFPALAAGNYTAYVKDASGCVGQAPATVAQGAALTVTASKINTSSCVFDGSMQATVSGGVAPYTYSKNGINGPYQSSSSFTGLGAGNYTIFAKDSKGCTGFVNVTINQNPINVTTFVVNASSCSSNNGSIQIFRTGGTGPYTYSINGNDYFTSPIFTGLAAGSYDCFVKDSKTCLGFQFGVEVGPSCPAGPVANSVTKTLQPSSLVKVSVNEVLSATAYPNPSNTAFTLSLTGGNKEKVSILVTDIMGRKLYQMEGYAGKQYRFGSSFMAGIYNLQVVQGTAKQNIKLVKE